MMDAWRMLVNCRAMCSPATRLRIAEQRATRNHRTVLLLRAISCIPYESSQKSHYLTVSELHTFPNNAYGVLVGTAACALIQQTRGWSGGGVPTDPPQSQNELCPPPATYPAFSNPFHSPANDSSHQPNTEMDSSHNMILAPRSTSIALSFQAESCKCNPRRGLSRGGKERSTCHATNTQDGVAKELSESELGELRATRRRSVAATVQAWHLIY